MDLPAQSDGFVPTAQWKERRFHEKWLGGDTMNMSIGQGYTLVTPLHVANMMAMVCNSGKIYKPHLLKEVRDPAAGNAVIQKVEPEVLHESTVSPEVWKEVQADLRYTITDGTAIYPMHNKTVQIAGKTGTAAVAGYSTTTKLDGFLQLPIQSFSMAITTFVGQNYGADQRSSRKMWNVLC